MKLWTHSLIALFVAVMLLGGCNKKSEDAKPMDSPANADTSMPAKDAKDAPKAAADEPEQAEPGGWVPPADDIK